MAEMTQMDLAVAARTSVRHVSMIVAGRSGITPDMAIRFTEAGVVPPPEFVADYPLRDPAEAWAALSVAYQVYQLRQGQPKLKQSQNGPRKRVRKPITKKPTAKKAAPAKEEE